MKVAIRDANVLASIRPMELMAYLRATGWSYEQVANERWTTWVKGGDFEIVLPKSNDIGDFVLRMADALKTLEIVEDRSQIEIFKDLSLASADVIRFRIPGADSEGTIAIEDGAQIIQHARDFIMAGACAVIEPRAVYQTRKPDKAVEYLKKVRMGQTERGSFVVTVISRVAPSLQFQNGNPFEPDPPYERQVTTKLLTAANSVRCAAANAVASANFDEFHSLVREGVSSNLCDAIHGLASGAAGDRGVEISCTWSRSRPVHGEIPARVIFTPDSLPIIEEASRLFRGTAVREEFELRGPVVKLERPEGSNMGKATISSLIEEKYRKVVIELSEEEYHQAVVAHDAQQSVCCLGSLIKEGRGYLLKNPRGFAIEPD